MVVYHLVYHLSIVTWHNLIMRRFPMPQAKIGVIGGTGLYDVEGLMEVEEVSLDTPFDKPSDIIVVGKLEGVGVAFLPRHGRGHRIMPSEVPSRANIYALKGLGVEHIIAINSVGSLKEEIKRGDLVIPDQLIDCTKGRINTFFGEGIVAHIQFAQPFCPSRLHRSWGADVIGMTALPEAKLAREAEICYAIIACATDYDVWHKTEEVVGVEIILDTMRRQEELCKKIIRLSVPRIADSRKCQCATALKGAIVTAPEATPAEQKKKLKLLIGKYIS
jgi:5'-methylthioadenosine phosphorylase